MLALAKYLEVVKTSLASFETNDVAIGGHLGVIHKKHQIPMSLEIECTGIAVTDPRKPVILQALQSCSAGPRLPRCFYSGPFEPLELIAITVWGMLAAPWCGLALGYI